MMFFFGSILVATLVDLHELKQGIPKLVQDLYTWSQKNLTWIDQYVLHGITYKGRGWNKDDFEWDNHKLHRATTDLCGLCHRHQLWKNKSYPVMKLK